MADIDERLRDFFDGREQPVDEIAPLDEHLQLAPAAAPGGDELLGILEAVVERHRVSLVGADLRRDDLVGGQGGTVMDSNYADHVVSVLQHDRLEAAALRDDVLHFDEQIAVGGFEQQAVNPLLGQDDELREVDGVGALAQDRALRALLAAIAEKPADIEEFSRLDVAGQRLRRA